MEQGKNLTLSAAIGERLRELRQGKGIRQEDIANSARDCGLEWTQATVAAVELGRRELSLAEVLLLPVAMVRSGADAVLADLLPPDDVWLSLTPDTSATASTVRALLASRPGGARADELDHPADRTEAEGIIAAAAGSSAGVATATAVGAALRTWKPLASKHDEERRRIAKHLGIREITLATETDTLRDATGQAELKAAWKLRVPSYGIALGARTLWGHSLSKERERRLRERDRTGLDRRGLQALRGHITRELLTELAPLVKGLRERRKQQPRRKGASGERKGRS